MREGSSPDLTSTTVTGKTRETVPYHLTQENRPLVSSQENRPLVSPLVSQVSLRGAERRGNLIRLTPSARSGAVISFLFLTQIYADYFMIFLNFFLRYHNDQR